MLAFIVGLMMASTSPSSLLTVPIAHAEERTWTQEEVKQYALGVATEFGLHKGRFLATLQCENQFNAKGQSNHYYMGVREKSFGVAQINLPSHKGVTQEMAENPYFAIPWMADKWVGGHASLWTCYRDLFL